MDRPGFPLLACPAAAIGTLHKRDLSPARRSFPFALADGYTMVAQTNSNDVVLVTMESTLTVNGITGAVLVKKNYTADGVTVASVANDPMQQHDVTVMFAREDGYDADNNNWFWSKLSSEGQILAGPPGLLAGRVLKGLDAGCIACHTAAPGDDMVFINNRY